ncbi:MAG: GTPase ObgE [Spirochaetota bacterium]|nr:GTPase ObgE [Spirochaetota bacterium]
MFTDEAEFHVKAGKGGDGMVSFRREKYVPFGGPDGGDGGVGGSVILKVKTSLRTLSHVRSKRIFKAEPGNDGGKQNKTGRDGNNCIIKVPLGTIIKDKETGEILGDLSHEDDEIIVARGGRGGKGNTHFMSATNQAPKYAQLGKAGEESDLYLELKLIADIGLVGFPNAGKSTLLSRLSNAHPKIGNYPFTTLYPNLGVAYAGDYDSFIIADIPGIIEGAHNGLGLGIRFLKHIERTKGLLFMIDIFEEEPFKQFELLINELKNYNIKMLEKPHYIALNKIDLFANEDRKEKLNNFFVKYKSSTLYNPDYYNISLISAATGEGLDELKKMLYDLIKSDLKEINKLSLT